MEDKRNWAGVGLILLIGLLVMTGVDADIQTKLIDNVSNSVVMIDFAHYEIHEGNSYTGGIFDEDVDADEWLNFTIVTPETTDLWVHMTLEVDVKAEARVTVYEGFTNTSVGTRIYALNRNRNSANTHDTLLYSGQDGVGDLLIYNNFIGSGKKIGGSGREINEVILKEDTAYIVSIQSEEINNKITLRTNFYEHMNG